MGQKCEKEEVLRDQQEKEEVKRILGSSTDLLYLNHMLKTYAVSRKLRYSNIKIGRNLCDKALTLRQEIVCIVSSISN